MKVVTIEFNATANHYSYLMDENRKVALHDRIEVLSEDETYVSIAHVRAVYPSYVEYVEDMTFNALPYADLKQIKIKGA